MIETPYDLALLLGAVLVWGMLAGVLLTVCVRRFVTPWRGRHRREEDV